MDIEREWLTVQEAADYLGVARPTIYRWAKQGRLPIYKLAEGVARVKAQDLKKFLEGARPLYKSGLSLEQPALQNEQERKELLAKDPILKVIGCLSGESLSNEEIENELYGKGSV